MGVYTEYMNYEMNMLRSMASKDAFPTYEEINTLINRATEGGPNAAETDGTLRRAAGRPSLDSEGPMDTYNDDYVAAIGTYRGKVMKVLRNAWTSRQQSDRAETDKVFHIPMLLMTGTVMDNAWKSLEDVSEGMKECSRCHTLDDATESIFRVIERTPDIDTEQAVSNVWSSLWRSRTTSVLRLHNMMSMVDTQALMNSRPADKKAFKKEWERAPEDSKQSAQALYNLIKPRAGKGPQSMPPSSMKLPGMPAVMATGWDWTRPNSIKNPLREIMPSIQAIMLEGSFVDEYRPEIVNHPAIALVTGPPAKFHGDLSDHDSTTLVPAGSKSTVGLGPRKLWNFPDCVEVSPDATSRPLETSEEVQEEQMKTQRRLASEREDREVILKIQKQVANLAIARTARGKKSPLCKEVADALHELVNALILSSSRLRLRTIYDNDKLSFHDFDDIQQLKITKIRGELDEYTVYSRRGDVDGEGSDDDEPAPVKTSKKQKAKTTAKAKGKGKAKAKASDALSDTSDGIEVITPHERSRASDKHTSRKPSAESEDPPAPHAEMDNARPKPRPKPVKKKTHVVDDVTTTPVETSQPTQEADDDDAPAASVGTDIERPTDDEPGRAEDAERRDDDAGSTLTSLDGDPPEPSSIIDPVDLANEMDGNGRRRSARNLGKASRGQSIPLPSRARAAPPSSRRRAGTSIDPSPSEVPSTSTKRSVNQAMLTPPKNRKKAKRPALGHLGAEEEELHMPTM
ncbi:hypothetical protein DFH29DRAFT_1008547 [Suillus ampliporus]|nr:hypothetical protein DFH29DRAFT_1008547 [Suillus ampliporus]